MHACLHTYIQVTLSGNARAVAGIPQEAAVFAFLFPAKIAWERLEDTIDTAHDNCHCLLAMAGGFAYFDQLVEH